MYGLFISNGVTLQIISGDAIGYVMIAFHKNGDKEYQLKGPGGIIESYPRELSEKSEPIDLETPFSSDDPWVGLWKLNREKSNMPNDPLTGVREVITTCREIDPDTMEIFTIRILNDGSKIVRWQFTVPKSGGIQNYKQGRPGPGQSVVKTIVDDHTQYLTFLSNGKQMLFGTIVLSEDGNTYTYTVYNKNTGRPFEFKQVLEKQ